MMFSRKNKVTKTKSKLAIAMALLLVAVSFLALGIVPFQGGDARPQFSEKQSWRRLSLLQFSEVDSHLKQPGFTPSPSVDCQSKPQADYPFCKYV